MTDTEVKSINELAGAALKVVNRDGGRIAQHEASGLRISLQGEGEPGKFPAEFAPPDMVRETRDWRGSYVICVEAPLKVLEIAWNSGEPFRIMSFSRGDWEKVLTDWAEGS
ncbi:MAG: hypothetical protein QGF09_02975 [Rhodospirillales bacterium]|jgi:hypothetical protein|nr:hypothetical protein [Rhodospirillales bacterium]